VTNEPKPSREEKLLKLATQVVQAIFKKYLSDAAVAGLAQSVVQQWQRHHGHAALFTPTHNIWLKHVEHPDGTGHIQTYEQLGNVALFYARRANLDAAAGLELMQQLNLKGEAEIRNREGKRIRVTVSPETRNVDGRNLDEDGGFSLRPE
jgi:hypothetical protein